MGKHRRNKEVEEEEDIAKDVKKKSRKKSKSKSKDVEKSAGDQTPRKRSKSDLSEKEKKKKRMKKDKKRKRDNDGETEERVHKKRKKSSKSASPSAPSSFVASTPAQKKSMEDFRNQEGIEVDGSEKDWLPIFAFADTGFDSEILDITKNWEKPTPIQSQTWPILISKRDVIGIAETGSGKTLAFGLPGLSLIKSLPAKPKSPTILIIAPTRELAIQTEKVLAQAGAPSGISTYCFYGGVSKHEQRTALRNGVDIAVATPGRLLDLCQEGIMSLKTVKYFVLDEADRMLDMGFETDIRSIARQIPAGRQTVMFSATWPDSIQTLAREFLNDPVKVTIGTEDLTANRNVKQIVEVIDDRPRNDRLIQLLKEYHDGSNRMIIFVLYKKEAVRVQNWVSRKGYTAVAIHGDLSQQQRMDSLSAFTEGSSPLLIATDVAARGLDIPKVEYVINFTFPLTIEDYVHRIGRTGRAGRRGIAHTFFQPTNKSFAGALVSLMKDAEQKPPPEHPIFQFPLFTKRKVEKVVEFKLGQIDVNAKAKGRITFSDSSSESE